MKHVRQLSVAKPRRADTWWCSGIACFFDQRWWEEAVGKPSPWVKEDDES